MTVGEWLHGRSPRPPAALVARLDSVLGDALGEPAARITDLLLHAGERLVKELRESNSTSRHSALDLLTADALVTYAFESASESPGDIEQRAGASMKRIAALGTQGPVTA